jgi:hypothetical protein
MGRAVHRVGKSEVVPTQMQKAQAEDANFIFFLRLLAAGV